MYRWKIEYLFKNGERTHGIYKGPENNSLDVANKLFSGDQRDFTSHFGMDEHHMLVVAKSEITAVDIQAWT